MRNKHKKKQRSKYSPVFLDFFFLAPRQRPSANYECTRARAKKGIIHLKIANLELSEKSGGRWNEKRRYKYTCLIVK